MFCGLRITHSYTYVYLLSIYNIIMCGKQKIFIQYYSRPFTTRHVNEFNNFLKNSVCLAKSDDIDLLMKNANFNNCISKIFFDSFCFCF